MKKVTMTTLAAVSGLMAAMTASASAQFYPRPFLYGGYYSGRIEIPSTPHEPAQLETSEIMNDLARDGYRPLRVVARRADVVVVDAISPRKTPVRLVIDAYDGEILERFARDREAPSAATGALTDPRKRGAQGSQKSESSQKSEGSQKSETRTGELPLPPRRPAQTAQSAIPAPSTPQAATPRPAPVAPARNPSQWAPLNSVPVTPLE